MHNSEFCRCDNDIAIRLSHNTIIMDDLMPSLYHTICVMFVLRGSEFSLEALSLASYHVETEDLQTALVPRALPGSRYMMCTAAFWPLGTGRLSSAFD